MIAAHRRSATARPRWNPSPHKRVRASSAQWPARCAPPASQAAHARSAASTSVPGRSIDRWHPPARRRSSSTACAENDTQPHTAPAGSADPSPDRRCRRSGPMYSTFCHVAPPSVVRNTPRSSLSAQGLPIAATITVSGMVRINRDAARSGRCPPAPCASSARRRRSICKCRCRTKHCCARWLRPFPPRRCCGFCGSTASAPMEATLSC